jgi:hypothetical protein
MEKENRKVGGRNKRKETKQGREKNLYFNGLNEEERDE